MNAFKIRFLPDDVLQDATEGATLLETARRAGFILKSECGGQGTCRRCKVKILSGDVFLTGAANLTESEREEGYTLSCLARITGDLEVEIPPESELRFAPDSVAAALTPEEHPGGDIRALGLKIEPLTGQVHLHVPPATPENNSPDWERLSRSLHEAGIPGDFEADLEVLQSLPRVLRGKKGEVTVAYQPRASGGIVTHLCEGDCPFYGIAFDLGTTTVFARLLDLETGEVIGETSDFNDQIPCGGDIIHRIVYAERGAGLQELRTLARDTMNRLCEELSRTTRVNVSSRTAACVVAGNTTMQHLFLGLDPKYIRRDPYVPCATRFPVFRSRDLELALPSGVPVFLTPSVASYVGGDITAGLLAAGVHRSDDLTLYVDLGTNGEIALGNRHWLTACACSAGPAFEGSGVKCGMRALPGGIDRVTSDATDGSLSFRTIGGGTPLGICGSGMIDLLAELRATGRINPRGKFNADADPRRIRRSGRRSEIVLIKGKDADGAEDIVVTEADLDNLIRTKGAIFAGIMTLLKGVGLKPQEIQRVVIAGAFGKYLDIENAIRIGMLPDLPRDRFEYIGNGSLRGAGLALLSRKLWEEMHAIADRITTFELSTWPGYMDEFMASLFLPHTDKSLFPSVV